MEFRNLTPFSAACYRSPDLNGQEHPVIALKVSHRVESVADQPGRCRAVVIDQDSLPLCMADTYYGEPGTSSVHSSIPPVPYPVTAELDTRLGIAKSMRAKGIPVVLYERSYTPSTIGDAAGKTKGVKSGTVEGKCHPLEHSGTVPAEGRYLVRHGDRFWMNGL